MAGLGVKLLAYTLLLSIAIIAPLIMLTLPAYSEIAGHYRTILTAQDTLTISQLRETLQTASPPLARLVSLYVASMLVLIISGFYMVNRLVIKPVKALTITTNQLAQGHDDIDQIVSQHDELGELAKATRVLQANLQHTLQRQEQESNALNNMLIELQAKDARSREVFNRVQDGLVITDGLGKVEVVNPAVCDLTGYSQDELIENNVDILIPESNRAGHQQKMLNFALDTNHPKRRYIRVNAQHKDGTCIPVEIGLSHYSINGKHHIIGVIHDIREREKAEKELLYERDRAQSYLDTAEVAIISIDTEGLITLVNRKCSELLGFSEQDLLGVDFFSLCPDQIVEAEMRDAYILHITENETFPKYFYISLRTREGSTRIFEWHNNTIKDYEWNTTGIILAGTDMTEFRKSIDERRTLRDRLYQAQKMQAVGQLSSGIAHDFNNILATMMGYTELLQDMMSDSEDESIQTYLHEIYISGERARDLIEGMLKYSRAAGDETNGLAETIYLPAMANDLSSMLHGILPANIKLAINIPQNAHPIIIDSINLQQIIINVCLNANEAMQAGGSLSINTSNVDNYHGDCSSCSKSFQGNFLEISITDTGKGIGVEALTHLFEPFYTTKVVGEVGKAAGMGLAVVHGLIHDAGGHIIVESKPGVGSIFRIMFPAATEQSVSMGAHG